MSDALNELRHALRRLLRSPAFTLAAVLTLGLGIGANTAIFAVVERVLLRPLPYDDSNRLIWVDHAAPGLDLPFSLGLSPGLYEYYRQRTRTFESLAIFRGDEWTLTGVGDPQRLQGTRTTASLVRALRVQPALGRWFTEKEAQDNAQVIVISHALWATRLGQDPDIIGRTVRLNGTPREVIGVMPRSFSFPDAKTQLYHPERIDERQTQTVGGFNYRAIARLRDAVDVQDVKREMDAFIAGMKPDFPNDPVMQQGALEAARMSGAPELLKDHEIGTVRRTLWILLGMVGLVLMIACANVANLFLVRSEARQREIAVRRALGAGHAGIVRYFMSESALLSAAGGALGAALAVVAVRLLVKFGPENLPRLSEVRVGGASVGWAVLLAAFATLLFGAIPLARRGRALAPTLREGGRGSTVGRARFRARNTLMAVQVALALVLLVGSGLMVRSFLHLRSVNTGFDPRSVLTFDISLSWNQYEGREAPLTFHESLLERIRALPGVETAGAASCLPLGGSCWGDPLVVRGRPVQPGVLPPMAQIRRALPGFFEALRIPVLHGRTLERADHRQRTNAVVVSRAFARAYFPGEDALGKQVGMMFTGESGTTPHDSAWYTIVGIVGDTPVEALTEVNPYAVIYLPALERYPTGNSVHHMAYAVRSAVDPLSLVRAVRAAAAEIDPNVAIGNVRSMQALTDEATARMEFTMVLLVIAGIVALLLGAVGIYGVISYIIGQRIGEIGVRLALGARRADVSAMLLRQSGTVVGAGLLAGLVAALALTRLMASLLFGVSASDPLTYTAVSSFLLGVAALATWLPARRAAALDPTAALRTE